MRLRIGLLANFFSLMIIVAVSLVGCVAEDKTHHQPQFTSTPVTTAIVGSRYAYDVDATNPDGGDKPTYSLITSPTGMAIDAGTGLITWSPRSAGSVDVTVKVTDRKGGIAKQSFSVKVTPANQAPQVNAGRDLTITLPGNADLDATVTDDGLPVGGTLATAWAKRNGPGNVTFGSVSAVDTAANFSEAGTYMLRLTATDGVLSTNGDITITVNPAVVGGSKLPPDPSTVAPPIDPTVATTMDVAAAFLYTGPNPIQTGVTAGTINPVRVAVIRGRVLDKENNALSGVTITVHNHPEFGWTLSRADGRFDLAVNGGGQFTLNYAKNSYLPVHRQVNTPWQDYVFAEDVVVIKRTSEFTTLNLTDTTKAFHVAQGSPVNDEDGIRQATLLIPQGTEVQVYNSDKTTRTLTSLNLRFTEYTVGANGPASMPAPLPSTSAYTYAVEIKADEAEFKFNGKDVLFKASDGKDQSVPFYVSNFLNFPVGTVVPVGYYDQDKSVWVPSDSGRVIKILAISNGSVDIDSDGDEQPDDGVNLTSLGITSQERTTLVGLFAAGQTLWRTQIDHLSIYDNNWNKRPPQDAEIPDNPAPLADKDEKDPECKFSSIVECENQVLREALPIVGSNLAVTYASNRVEGRKAKYTALIPVSGSQLPASLKSIELLVDVAGRHFAQSLPPQPNQRYTFTWDGMDGYGRGMNGALARIRIGYTYDAVYQGTERFGYTGFGSPITGNKARQEISLWQDHETVRLGVFPAKSIGPAGWSLSVQHAYDPVGKTLYLGTGERRSTEAAGSSVINTVAINQPGFQLSSPGGVVAGSDGSLYIADTSRYRILRLSLDGNISLIAGNGLHGSSCGQGPATATSVKIGNINSIAFSSDGSLYIADSTNNCIRRVGKDGIITTYAGKGTVGPADLTGDGGPATEATLNFPEAVAIGPDGSLYIAERGRNRIRQVGPDGLIATVAGNGQIGDPIGDEGAATNASLWDPRGIAVDREGNLYIAEYGRQRIRLVRPNGIITTYAGKTPGRDPLGDPPGDGKPATEARVFGPYGIALGSDGSLYIAEYGGNRIRRVAPDGIITTVAGDGTWEQFKGDGGPAPAASLRGPRGVTVSPDGSIYVADSANNRIRRVSSRNPGYNASNITISSEDGSEVYRFNSSGRHLETVNALTRATIWKFEYGPTDRLTFVKDGSGNTTTIERDDAGNPTAIVSPFDQITTLTLDANGYLAKVTNPAGESYRMLYTTDGLLKEFKNPKGNVSKMNYDPLGRLNLDTDAVGGFMLLTRTETDRSHTVNLDTALGRTNRYLVDDMTTGNQRRLTTAPDGTQTETLIGADGSHETTLPDGTVINLLKGPDPRFSMQAPIPKSLTVITGGLTSKLTIERETSLADPTDQLSLTALKDTVTYNGRKLTTTYNAGAKTAKSTSFAGRSSTATFDDLGRVVRSEMPGLLPMTLTYDSRGRLESIAQDTGPNERKATFAYNPQGYLATLTDPLGRSVGFAYDDAGRVKRQTLPDGRAIAYGYDANGNLASLTPPGRPPHVFSYTTRDEAAEYKPPPVAGTGSTQYEYDLDRNLKLITRPDAKTLGFNYDSAGRLKTLTLPAGQVVGYDYAATTGKLTGITAQDAALAYTYNGALLSQTGWTGTVAGTVDRTYDNDFRVTSLSINGANPINFQYDADSLLKRAGDLTLTRDPQNGLLKDTALANVTDSYAYNGFGEVTAYEAKYNVTSLLRFEYAHDKLGRITRKKEIRGGTTHIFDYGYDAAGRLAEVKRNGAVTSSYGYDANGNRTHVNGAVAAHYDDQDRLIDYQGATYQYAANGELRTKTMGASTTTYQYDVLGNLKSVALPDGRQIEYLVDGQNRRVGKKVNGTLVQRFLYQSQLRPIAELDGSGNIVSRFIYGVGVNVPDYMIKGGVTYRLIKDHLGSPRLILDVATDTVSQEMDYDAFGNILLDTNLGFQPFGFAGGLYDRDTTLLRFGARDYDAHTGRWTAKDAILFLGATLNIYAYALSNPTNLTDVSGDITDTESANIWKLLMRGELEQAIGYMQVRGLTAAAAAFERLKWAFDAAQRRAGPCWEVADRIRRAFEAIGKRPIVRILSTGRQEGAFGRIGRDGVGVPISQDGQHAVVELEGKFFDNFTTISGQKIKDYMDMTHPGSANFPIKILE